MKKLIYYSMLSTFLLTGCWDSSAPIPERPPGIPKGVPRVWEHWHQQAYEQGRMGWNPDSTVMVIISPRPSRFPEVKDFHITKDLIDGNKGN